CPTLTGIRAANGNSLPSESQRPDIWRVGVGDVRLDRFRLPHLRRIVNKNCCLRKRILNVRIAFDSGYVLPASQRFNYFTAAFHQDRVSYVERAMLNAALTQPLKDRPLCCEALIPQRIVNVATFLSLCG